MNLTTYNNTLKRLGIIEQTAIDTQNRRLMVKANYLRNLFEQGKLEVWAANNLFIHWTITGQLEVEPSF